MYEQLLVNLQQAGWTLTVLEHNWVLAVSEPLQRGLLLGHVEDLPEQFKPWVEPFAHITRWDGIVFCTAGLASEQLKQYRVEQIQLWYWDIRQGGLFPYPPSNDRWIPLYLRQLITGGADAVNLADSENTMIPVRDDFRPYLSYMLIGLILLYYLVLLRAGLSLFPGANTWRTDTIVLITFGAKVNELIRAGEVWRLFTSMFIHLGILHLAFNAYALRMLGPLTEKSFGRLRFLVIYMLSGLGGSLASFWFSPNLSVGASGAIFGMLGAMLCYAYKRPALWKSGFGANLLLVVFVNFGFGLTMSGIDNFAHLGGFLTGVLVSLLLAPKTAQA